jgi:chromosomal replication initiator protein
MPPRTHERDDHSFLVLRENRLAFTAVSQLATATSAKGPIAPVTIYGPSGTGKSHLARHAVRAFHEHSSKERAISVTAAQFAEELAEASASKTLPDFVRRYRAPAGLFVCEDVQALSSRRETQEQLISLWNDLVARQARILITVDRPPGELRDVNPKLINRMQGGVCVGTARLGDASRQKLVSHFAQSMQLPLSDDQVRQLASAGAPNGHELWGLITAIRTRLKAKPQLGLKGALEAVLGEQPDLQAPSLNEIAKAVAAVFGSKVAEIRSEARDRRLAIPRQMAMLIMRDVGRAQLGEIGEFFGGRTHSTVLHGCRRIADQIREDEKLRLQFEQACGRLRRGRPTP